MKAYRVNGANYIMIFAKPIEFTFFQNFIPVVLTPLSYRLSISNAVISGRFVSTVSSGVETHLKL